MLLSILEFLTPLFKALASLISYMEKTKLINSGKEIEKADSLKQQLDGLQSSNSAREEIREKLIKEPDKVNEDDEFLRD